MKIPWHNTGMGLVLQLTSVAEDYVQGFESVMQQNSSENS